MFYEQNNSMRNNLLKLQFSTDFSFPAHLHSSYEVITILEGESLVTVGSHQYTMGPGDAVLIFPNQLHSIHTPEHSNLMLSIFSPRLVQAYTTKCEHRIPKSNLFRPDSFYLTKLSQLRTAADEVNIPQAKGVLYSLCAEFDENATYTQQHATCEDLLSDIFHFVEENYQKDCSLEALAMHTGYHYVYLSRYFKQATGLTYLEYVHHFRVDEACYLLENTRLPILQVAYDCGYDSLRSFNRNFRKIMSVTPRAYQSAYTHHKNNV